MLLNGKAIINTAVFLLLMYCMLKGNHYNKLCT